MCQDAFYVGYAKDLCINIIYINKLESPQGDMSQVWCEIQRCVAYCSSLLSLAWDSHEMHHRQNDWLPASLELEYTTRIEV